MSFLRTHLALMIVYAASIALFFALLWKETRRDRVRTFVVIFLSLLFGGTVLGWAMYPFPQ